MNNNHTNNERTLNKKNYTRADYKICGPFFQHHFQVIQVDDGNEDDTIERLRKKNVVP